MLSYVSSVEKILKVKAQKLQRQKKEKQILLSKNVLCGNLLKLVDYYVALK